MKPGGIITFFPHRSFTLNKSPNHPPYIGSLVDLVEERPSIHRNKLNVGDVKDPRQVVGHQDSISD